MNYQLPTDFHMDLWQDGPLNRWAFQHVSDFLTTQDIYAHPLQCISKTIVNLMEDIDVNIDERIFKLSKLLEDTHTDSIVVLRNGNVVYERYLNGMEADSKHLLQSVSKSILGVLYARMIDKGVIDPERPMGYYIKLFVHFCFH